MSATDQPRPAPPSLARVADVRSQQVETVSAYLRVIVARAAQHGVRLGADGLALPAMRPLSRWQAAGSAKVPPRSKLFAWDAHTAAEHGRMVILAPAGTGKTRVLHFEASRLAGEATEQLRKRRVRLDGLVVPIMVNLTDLSASDDGLEDALIRHATESIVPETEPVPHRLETLRRLLRDKLYRNACVVLLDSWDQVPMERPRPGAPIRYEPHRRQRLGRRLGDFALQFPDTKLILTSRIAGYTGMPFEATHVELLA